MKPRSLLFITVLFFSLYAPAQNTALLDSVGLYGNLLANIAVLDQSVEMQNNGSRIGVYLQRMNIKGFNAEGKFELGVNLLKNNNSFSPDAATLDNPSSFLNETVKPVTTRLGYIGLNSKKWGTLRIGKQWGVYYDVSSFTDNFNVFGGLASGTYNTGTDAGSEGTGRAESSITYHNTFHNLTFGLQAQIPGITFNFGGSMVYQLSHSFTIGAAYNYYEIPKNLRQAIINSEKVANSVVTSLKYKTKKTYFAVSYAFNESEIQYPTDTTIVGFAANGIELYAHHYFTDKFIILAGFNYLITSKLFNSVPKNYRVFTIPVGAAYYLLPEILCYTEVQFDQGISINGNKKNNVYVIGLSYNFSSGRSVRRN